MSNEKTQICIKDTAPVKVLLDCLDEDSIVLVDEQGKERWTWNRMELFYFIIHTLSCANKTGQTLFTQTIQECLNFTAFDLSPKSKHHVLAEFEESLLYVSMLHKVLCNSFYNIYVSDGAGQTLFVNKAVERTTGRSKDFFLKQNVFNLSEKGEFYPSAIQIALQEKKEITILQQLKNGEPAIVSAVPIFNPKGDIEFVVTNGRILNDESRLVDRQILEYIDSQSSLVEQEEIVFGSPKSCDLLALLKKIARVDSTILILGESGVGKSMYARYIHRQSQRAGKKFVEISCGAIPEHLLESELFGYEAGAFSGANRTGKPGLIEIADGGTLFLDEIGDMPLHLQVKLLSVLQERKTTRVGGTREINIDVRILSATNQNLEDLVAKGQFRNDLYYRLNVVPVVIEPLRDRKEDIAVLLKYYLNKFNKKYMKAIALSESSISQLEDYTWPGNVRELQNFVERIVVTGNDGFISSADLPALLNNEITLEDSEQRKPNRIEIGNKALPKISVEGIMPLNEMIEEAERQLIKNASKEYTSSYKLAAALNISQSLAYRKLQKYVISELEQDQ